MKKFLFLTFICLIYLPSAMAMTLEEKAGQVIFGAFLGDDVSPELREMISDMNVGGLIFFSGTGNIKTTEQTAALIEKCQKLAKIPLFIGIDQEGGRVARIRDGITVFPGNMALGATADVNLAARQARVMARELRILGFNWDFAPVADVNSNPANPIIGVRSFGSDPGDVSRFVNAMLPEFAREGVLTAVKHFPGHGDTATDSHYGLPEVNKSLAELEKTELIPFRNAVKAGVPAIMTSHLIVPALGASDVPVTLSKEALSFLREKMGFDGLILTDAMLGMKAITENWGAVEGAIMALNAGADVLIFGYSPSNLGEVHEKQKQVYARIIEAVKNGELSEKRLDDAVARIIKQKEKMGMFDAPQLPMWGKMNELASKQNLAVAREVGEKSVTLVRGEKKFVPLKRGAKISLIYAAAHKNFLPPLLKEIPNVELVELPDVPAKSDFEKIAKISRNSDVVIALTAGLAEGVRANSPSAIAWKSALEKIDGEKFLLISLRTPYDIEVLPNAAGYIAAFSEYEPSMTALGKILSGKIKPTGKLPIR